MHAIQNKRPLIGITCGEIVNQHEPWWAVTYGQTSTYIQSITKAGGVPILLPLSTDGALLKQLGDICDGILFAGGNDIHPKYYGQEPYKPGGDYSALRDTSEMLLLKHTLESQKPILAICRGMQLLNVYYGGTLYQDIATQLPDALDHNSSTKLKSLVDLSHKLHIKADTKLMDILGSTTIGANAHHHQAIDVLGDGVLATAHAADGIIEAIELTQYPYAIGIQAHPESLTDVEPRWGAVFESFIKACNK